MVLLHLHGPHRLWLGPHVTELVIWRRFISQWIGSQLCIVLSLQRLRLPSLFLFPLIFLFFTPYIFLVILPLLPHIFLELIYTLRFFGDWHVFYRTQGFLQPSYKNARCTRPHMPTHSPLLHASLVLPVFDSLG